MNDQKNLNIEVLRGISILFVIIAHSYFIKELENVRNYFDFGRGVDLFFVISGYLMGVTYVAKLNLNCFEFKKAYNFYVKRICRLFPAVFFWNIVLLSLTYFWKKYSIFHSSGEVFRSIISNISFVGNFFNASYVNGMGYWWSIGLEVQFYLLLPILIYTLQKYFWKTIITCLFLSCFFDLFIQFSNFWMFRFHALFLGLLIWKISTTEEFNQIKDIINLLNPLQVHAILLFFLLSALTLTKSINGYQFSTNLFTALMLSFALFIAISYNKVLLTKYLSDFLIFMGKIAFSLYVSHIMVFALGVYFLDKIHLKDSSIAGIGIYLISIIVAYLSYKYIEPVMKKEKYLIK